MSLNFGTPWQTGEIQMTRNLELRPRPGDVVGDREMKTTRLTLRVPAARVSSRREAGGESSVVVKVMQAQGLHTLQRKCFRDLGQSED